MDNKHPEQQRSVLSRLRSVLDRVTNRRSEVIATPRIKESNFFSRIVNRIKGNNNNTKEILKPSEIVYQSEIIDSREYRELFGQITALIQAMQQSKNPVVGEMYRVFKDSGYFSNQKIVNSQQLLKYLNQLKGFLFGNNEVNLILSLLDDESDLKELIRNIDAVKIENNLLNLIIKLQLGVNTEEDLPASEEPNIGFRPEAPGVDAEETEPQEANLHQEAITAAEDYFSDPSPEKITTPTSEMKVDSDSMHGGGEDMDEDKPANVSPDIAAIRKMRSERMMKSNVKRLEKTPPENRESQKIKPRYRSLFGIYGESDRDLTKNGITAIRQVDGVMYAYEGESPIYSLKEKDKVFLTGPNIRNLIRSITEKDLSDISDKQDYSTVHILLSDLDARDHQLKDFLKEKVASIKAKFAQDEELTNQEYKVLKFLASQFEFEEEPSQINQQPVDAEAQQSGEPANPDPDAKPVSEKLIEPINTQETFAEQSAKREMISEINKFINYFFRYNDKFDDDTKEIFNRIHDSLKNLNISSRPTINEISDLTKSIYKFSGLSTDFAMGQLDFQPVLEKFREVFVTRGKKYEFLNTILNAINSLKSLYNVLSKDDGWRTGRNINIFPANPKETADNAYELIERMHQELPSLDLLTRELETQKPVEVNEPTQYDNLAIDLLTELEMFIVSIKDKALKNRLNEKKESIKKEVDKLLEVQGEITPVKIKIKFNYLLGILRDLGLPEQGLSTLRSKLSAL